MNRLNGVNRVGRFYDPAGSHPEDRFPGPPAGIKPVPARPILTSTAVTQIPPQLAKTLVILTVSLITCGFGVGLIVIGIGRWLEWLSVFDPWWTVVYGAAATMLGAVAGLGALVTLFVRLEEASYEEWQAFGDQPPRVSPRDSLY